MLDKHQTPLVGFINDALKTYANPDLRYTGKGLCAAVQILSYARRGFLQGAAGTECTPLFGQLIYGTSAQAPYRLLELARGGHIIINDAAIDRHYADRLAHAS